MKQRAMTALVLAAAMTAALLTGCGGSTAQTPDAGQTAEKNETAAEDALESETPEADVADAAGKQTSPLSVGTAGNGGEAVIEGVDYVLIYNPNIYDELDSSTTYLTSLTTGDLAGRILTGINRAGGMEGENATASTISQAELTGAVDMNGIDRSGARAEGLAISHSVGEQADFFTHNKEMNARVTRTFTCVYEGEHCYIWSFENSVSEAEAQDLGNEFDSTIYPKDTEAFGQGRFTENGGKVNILMYPLREGLCGFFTPMDIFASYECPADYAAANGFNLDQAIININSDMLKNNRAMTLSTLAHEYQHQICASDVFNYKDTPWMRTWLNEAMSAYAEDMIYPTIMDEEYYNQLIYLSDSYRKGQSLYNFGVTQDDIGAYGAVCLFERYLATHTGEDIFHKIHEYWRNSYRADVTEAQTLYESVSDSFRQEIDGRYTWPASVEAAFADPADSWMSKMTLDYYLEIMDMDLAHLVGAEDAARRYMLYTEINRQEIEGGGRMLVATENGSFAIPDDADDGLVYIGFDKDFNTVTGILTAE